MTDVATQKLIGEMNDAEFDALIGRFIERETKTTGETPASVLFEALPDFFATEPIQHIEVGGELQGDRLVLSVPKELPSRIQEIEVRFPTMWVVVSVIPQIQPQMGVPIRDVRRPRNE